MNSKCFILLLVSIGAVAFASAVNYEKVAKEIFSDLLIGPIHIAYLGNFVYHFLFQDQEYELRIEDAVIRRFDPSRFRLRISEEYSLETEGQHSMKVILVLETLTMDSKVVYKKKGSNESPKELNLVSKSVLHPRFVTAITTDIYFDVYKRKVLDHDRVWLSFLGFDTTSNCNEQAPGFCHALHEFLSTQLYALNIKNGLQMEMTNQLTGRRY